MREYKFNESIPYLLARIGVQLGDVFSQRLASTSITLPMYRVLASLQQKPEQTLGELSEAVSVEISTLSRLVGQMDKAGLLTRTRPAENARIVRINLTPAGVETLLPLIPLAMQIEDTVIEELGTQDVEVFRSLLARISRNVNTL